MGAFIPLNHLYFILTQQNRSSSTFFFLFSELPRDVFFNVDFILHILMVMLRKAPAAGKAFCLGVDIKNGVPVWQQDLAQGFCGAWNFLGSAAHALCIGVPPQVSVCTHGFSSAWRCVPQIPLYQHCRKTPELGQWREQGFCQWSQLAFIYQEKEFLICSETFSFPLETPW